MNSQLDWYTTAAKKEGPRKTATIVVFRKKDNNLEVLLGKRKNPPCEGEWGFPGGHIEEGEKNIDAALRELKEETNLTFDDLTFVVNRSRNPDGSENDDTLYTILAKTDDKVKAGSDSTNTKWVAIDSVEKLAFQDEEYLLLALAKLFEAEINRKSFSENNLKIALAVSNISEETKQQVNGILSKAEPNKNGLLIVIEGPDGVGKSTQIDKLVKWLENQKYDIFQTKWNSSDLLRKSIKKAKRDRVLTPLLYSLIHAADMVYRYEQEIIPALENNKMVLCDRYIYTSKVRDAIRGVDITILNKIYKDFRKPDVIFNCVAPIEVAFTRLIKGKGLSYYGSGSDMNLSHSREENALKYEKLMADEYKSVLKEEDNCVKIDMDRTPSEIFEDIKSVMGEKFSIGKYR